MFRRIFLILSVLFSTGLFARVSVTVTLDSTAIMIGQQAHILLKVVSNSNQHVVFPVFPNKQLTEGVEVVEEAILETEKLDDEKQTSVTKKYTITSFDSALYYIPPFKVRVDNKVYSSKNLALKVETMHVDTLHVDKYFGPKEIADVPFSWNDWKGMLVQSLLLLLLLVVLGYISLQLHNKKPLMRRFRLKPTLPPHQWAMKEIEKLNHQKETREDSKEYYTQLTDVLRSYIQRRYGFNAKEMTSAEIIEQLTQQQDKTSVTELQQLFQTADLAKFAKLRTLLNENDENLLRAVDFIKATKVEVEAMPKKPIEIAPEINRSHRSRLILKLINVALVLGCLLLLYFVGQSIYYLFF